MNLDIHAHCNSGDPADVRAFVENSEKNDTMTALSGGLHYGGHDYLPNEEVIKLCKEYPKNLVPLVKIDLWDTAPDVSLVRKYADMGAKGFKFIYPYYGYDHESYLPLYEEIQKIGLPVLFHTGAYRPNSADVLYRRPVLENMSPARLDTIARSFPDLKIVMAHLGTRMFRPLAAELVRLHANLYFDLAGSGNFLDVSPADLAELMMPPVYTRDKDGPRFRKMVFGSDSYIKLPIIQTEALEAYKMHLLLNQISPEDKEAIMGKTVASWMGIKL
ncbi:MAG: amidohydrolase family protein [Lentisphaeria bacterium]|nr:amidohydrolase family protein [Lentisphaeria bacterium]